MSTEPPVDDPDPPRWAERLLRLVLGRASRDTITGDLLEEYREVVWPARGPAGARRWYLRQAASVVLLSNTPAQWGIWLAAAGAMAAAFFLRHHLDPPFPAGAWTALAIVAGAALSMRPADVRFLWRASVAFGILFVAAAIAASLAATLLVAPGDQPVGPFGLPGRLLLACCAAVFVAAGFRGAWRGHRIGTGILAAVGTSIVGAAIWMGLVTGLSMVSPALLQPLGPMSALAWSANNHLMVVLSGIAPGVFGAILGKGLGSVSASLRA